MHRQIEEGVPLAEVARRLGRSRQTLYNWLKQGERKPVKRGRASKLDPHRAYIESRLERFDLPATVLFREIRAQGYTGGITILKEHVAAVKVRHVRRLVERFETEPGRQAQVDFGSCGTIRHQGHRRRLSLIAVVLGYSRVIWARFLVSERRPVLVASLEAAFRAMGGVPKELLFDNLKQVVASPRSADSPATIQEGFLTFAEHFGFAVVASPPYWPRAKGKVERVIGYIKTSFLEGRSFRDLEDLNAQLRLWLAEVANVRRHGTTGERPCDRLAADREAMLPLGTVAPYPSLLVRTRLADHDGRISYGGVRYSVDPGILGGRRGEPVTVKEGTDGRLRVFHRERLVGCHRVVPAGSPPQDDPLHAAKRRRLRQQPSFLRSRGKAPCFEQVGEETGSWPGAAAAPVVAHRSLDSYEVTLCRPS